MVDDFGDENEAVIYITPNSAAVSDGITKLIFNGFLKAFTAKENEEVCSGLSETKKKRICFSRSKCFFV